jgi:hypothetical protein
MMVFPGERRLKRQIIRRIWKEKLFNLLRKIFGKEGLQNDQNPQDSSEK